MKIIIADDEKLARLRLSSLLMEVDDSLEIISVENGYQALKKYKQTQATVLLLDIRMPEMDGLQVAYELMKFDNPPAVIFTTAYDSHALQAFEANAVDYLLKPVRKDRLHSALQKVKKLNALQFLHLKQDLPKEDVRTHLCVQRGNDLHLVALDKIIYFHAEQKYVLVKTATDDYLLDEPLKKLEEEFADTFLRIHRNALVSLQYIEDLHKLENGQILIQCSDLNEKLIVSRRLMSKVRQSFKEFQSQKNRLST